MSTRARTVMVALDGADKDLLLTWMDAGRLPALHRLRERGAWGVTLGPLGMHPGAVWHSLATAVNPGRHGRHADRQLRHGSYEMHRFWPSDVKSPPFWHDLSRKGLRLAVIDVPYLPLDPTINGLQVVDWLAHSCDTGFRTAPPSLADTITDRFGRDPLGLCDHLRVRSGEEISTFRDTLLAKIQQKTRLVRHVLSQGEWDLLLVAYGESHCVGHQCWHVHDASHPFHDATIARDVGDPMLDVYRALDAGLTEVIEAAGPEASVVVLATHGFGPNYNGAHLLPDILYRLGQGPPPAKPSAAWTAVRRLWRMLPKQLRVRLTPIQKAAVDQIWPNLDGRYECFAVPNGEVWGAIRINRAGREPQGRVAAGAAYEELCATLSRNLLELVNVETGQPAVRRVLRTADVCAGPYLDHLPDLMIEWNASAPLNVLHSEKTGTIEHPFDGWRSGHHRREGMFVMSGAGIRPGYVPDTVSIMDVAPTVAALLGVELDDADGRAISNVLSRPASSAARPRAHASTVPLRNAG